MKSILIIVAAFLVMSTVGAYAGTSGGTEGPLSSSSRPTTISWSLNRGEVDSIIVTWTPVEEGTYRIKASVVGVTETTKIYASTTTIRTDVLPIAGVPVEDLGALNVAIVKS